jgi:ABC-type spermidine/putrescine transport system permease subunit I
MSRQLSIIVFILTGLYFVLFFAWPIGETLRGAFFTSDGTLTLSYIIEVFRNPIYLEGLANAFLLAVASTILAIFLAFPLAFLSDRYIFPGKSILSGLILVPMILPPFVGAIGIKQILGQEGALNALLQTMGFMNAEHPVDWLGQGRFEGVVVMSPASLRFFTLTLSRRSEISIPQWRRPQKTWDAQACVVPAQYASSHHARAFCRCFDRLHLGVHGLGVPLMMFEFTG